MTGPVHNFLARNVNRVMYAGCVLCAVIILGVLLLVVAYLAGIGWHSISLSFFTRDPIPLGMEGAPGGMRNAILGTIILILLASVIGVPMGMLAGIYLSEYDAGSWMTGPVRV